MMSQMLYLEVMRCMGVVIPPHRRRTKEKTLVLLVSDRATNCFHTFIGNGQDVAYGLHDAINGRKTPCDVVLAWVTSQRGHVLVHSFECVCELFD